MSAKLFAAITVCLAATNAAATHFLSRGKAPGSPHSAGMPSYTVDLLPTTAISSVAVAPALESADPAVQRCRLE
jgi:hypothetical protein